MRLDSPDPNSPDHGGTPGSPSAAPGISTAAGARGDTALRTVDSDWNWYLRTSRTWADLFDLRRPEVFLALCSSWAALQLWVWPTQFGDANALVARRVGLVGHEATWALFASLAAILKVLGLASRLTLRWSKYSSSLLISGLFMSIVFWTTFAISAIVDFPHKVMPIALLSLGLAAAWQLSDWRRRPGS